MSMREGQAYKNLANTLKTACGSGASCTRCNFSLSTKPYSILSLWLSPCSLGTLSTLQDLQKPETWISIVDHWFGFKPATSSFTWCPFLIQGKAEWAVDGHWLSPCPPVMILKISVFSFRHLSPFQVDSILPSIWYIWFLEIGKWHWSPLVLRSNCTLSEIKHLKKEINIWFPCCTFTCEWVSTNLIFH